MLWEKSDELLLGKWRRILTWRKSMKSSAHSLCSEQNRGQGVTCGRRKDHVASFIHRSTGKGLKKGVEATTQVWIAARNLNSVQGWVFIPVWEIDHSIAPSAIISYGCEAALFSACINLGWICIYLDYCRFLELKNFSWGMHQSVIYTLVDFGR